MKLAIIGSRDFNDYNLLRMAINEHFTVSNITEIVSGGAKGADKLGAKFAEEHKINLKEFIPDWNKHGKAAGMIRNKDIINQADAVIAFWDGKSRGTQNSLGLAKKQKKTTVIVYF